jgi:hypothetical protein
VRRRSSRLRVGLLPKPSTLEPLRRLDTRRWRGGRLLRLLLDALRRVSDALRWLLAVRLLLDALRVTPEARLLLDVLRLLRDDLTGMVSPLLLLLLPRPQAWARIRCTNSLNR